MHLQQLRTHTHTQNYTHTHMYTHLHTYLHMRTQHTHMHACKHINFDMHMYTHTHTFNIYLYLCTHSHTYTCNLCHGVQSQGASPKASPKISPKINKKMVSVPNLLRPLPPEPVENNIQVSSIMKNGSVPHKDPKSRSQSVPEAIPISISPPLRSPPLKKYSYNDFEYLKVLGKGSFGKVMYLTVWIHRMMRVLNYRSSLYAYLVVVSTMPSSR